MRFSKSILPFLLAVGLLAASGCGAEKPVVSSSGTPQGTISASSATTPTASVEQQTVVRQTLTTLFNGPNAAYIGQSSTQVLGEGVSKADSASRESLPDTPVQSAFTTDAYSTFVANALSLYHGFAQDSGQRTQLKDDAVQVSKTDTGYSFTANVQYGKGESINQTAKITGTVQFNDSGKLCFFRIDNDSGLIKALQEQK